MQNQNEPDVHGPQAVILTAIRAEYQAVRAHLRSITERTHPQGTVYETGTFACPGGDPWSVAIVEIGVGNPGAALETERAARFFKPSVLMFVGVAGGLKDVQLGDVVVATKVYGYEAGKAKGSFEPRPSVGESSYFLVQRAHAEARKDEWRKRLIGSSVAKAAVHVGPIAAGEKVVASRRSEVFRFLRAQYGDALAVEMEGRGFLQAAHANPNIAALIVRGISDLLSRKAAADRAAYQVRAAETASAFAFEILARLGAPRGERDDYITVIKQIAKYSDMLDTQLTAAREEIQQRETALKSFKSKDCKNLKRIKQLEKQLTVLREARSVLETELEQLRKPFYSDDLSSQRVPRLDPVSLQRTIDAIARLEAEFNWGTFGGVTSPDIRSTLLTSCGLFPECVSTVKRRNQHKARQCGQSNE